MKEQILAKIRESGVVGAGGAGLPTHVKANASVETVLVNGASCEPLLMSDPWLMEAETATMLRGLHIMMDCTGARKGIVCLKGKHKKALTVMREAVAADRSGRLEVFELRDFYPAGDEHVLVHEVLGRTVPERGLPLQVGAVVSNTESLYNMALAMDGIPVTDRYLTVTGEVGRHMVIKTPVGTQVSEILDFAGGPTITDYRVVDGGPMMGKVLPNTQCSITKTTSGLIVLPPEHTVVAGKIMDPARVRRITNTICCQCTRCTDLCPRNLLGHSLNPHKLMRVMESMELDSPVAKEALLCSECGVCEKFACPMGVSPREVNAMIKKSLMKAGAKWESSSRELKANPFRNDRTISTGRLIQRLNLGKYDTHPGYAGEYTPSRVNIALNQHLGAPATCTVSAGARVQKGEVIGEIPEKAMGARVHASISGTVESIIDGVVTIKA